MHHTFSDTAVDTIDSFQFFSLRGPALTEVRIDGLTLDCCLPPLGTVKHLALHFLEAQSRIPVGKILSSAGSLVALNASRKIVDGRIDRHDTTLT